MNMKRFLFFFFAFLAIGSGIQAQNVLQDVIQVDDVEIAPGGNATVTVHFNAANAPTSGLKGLQFDLYLPEGFTLERKTAGNRNCKVFDKQDDAFSVSAQVVMSNGAQVANQIRFVVAAYEDNTLLFEDGDLFSITLVADEGIVIDDYQGVLAGRTGMSTSVVLTGDEGTTTLRYTQEPVTFNIFMPLTYDEKEDYTIADFKPSPERTVTMIRTVAAGKWNTICLPFAMTETQMKDVFGENVLLAEFTGCDEVVVNGNLSLKLKFSTITPAISANTPYLIKSENDVSEFSLKVNLSELTQEPTATGGNCTFVGTYANAKNLNNALYISNETFKLAVGNTNIKSFRGYFTHPDIEQYNNANVTLFVDDVPTGIRTVTANPENNDVYDLSGRKVNSDKVTLKKGVYIVNGKKETVR